MNVHITYKLHKTPDIEKEINHLLDKLRRRLQVYKPELVHLKGIVEQSSAREGAVVSLNLRLPSGQMAAQHPAPTATAALKAASDDLLHQITKHKDLLRSTHKWPRRRSQHDHLTPQTPFEETLAAVHVSRVCPDDIRSYVNANLNRLEVFVERELYFREAAGQLSPGSVTKEEVVDEAVARALGDGEEKPERLALEPWLYHLTIRSMNEICAQGNGHDGEVRLEDSAREQNVSPNDEAELQFRQPEEAYTGEIVIADNRVGTPEDIASSDEMIRLVQSALASSKRTDREAFLLYALEGFSVDDVASITGRPADEVQRSIAVTRTHLRKSPFMSASSHPRSNQRTGTA
jgi:DNA-directed RNA polymerase specialized sigma24 family protein/ribosome-associated translation inhibitor RaiA